MKKNTYDLNDQYKEMFEAHLEMCKKLQKENDELREEVARLRSEGSKRN